MKQGDTWSIERPTEQAWNRVMQFKWKHNLIPTLKSEQAWNRWVGSLREETVVLLVYEYGQSILNARAHEEFLKACVRPVTTDRFGAIAESSLREVARQLKFLRGRTFQGTTATWRVWANDITKNLDRSTWDTAILDP
ncbi:hypothetical protein JG687_00013386 [Phytophthora cactorum]|uniref:Uncharacterized protein n=1 Tax=Phytophthora cactorum TaxID=29920 RepID=A0A8T1HII1_9STRA|nr:hypothetical protein Pcac1_g21614 [Phytophthora cactorum]KAG2806563.1 hypothetical protein PC112_g17788 [Phytophthora cactorum]KAG2850076.1 hypothetical protein PC113_g17098 [Phytophthora cactorum]KAG2883449.1 hypothetical protein PC114_g20583 [Phytophthora cactorum]KAG2896717.1 hypothetical protein PC115_g17426 [Phytophthora cactorum]